MSTGTLAPYWLEQFIDGDGVPYAGGFIYTYEAGGTTPATTWTTSDISVATGIPNSNPIVLNAAGKVPSAIYLDTTSYKFVLKDSNGVTIKTQDNIPSESVGSLGIGEIFEFGGLSSSPITQTAYASGSGFDTLHPGTAVYQVNSTTLTGTYIMRATGNCTAAMTVALMNLSDGAPDTPIATCVFAATAGNIVSSSGITFGAVGSFKFYGIKPKMASGYGYAWGISIVRTS